MKLPHLQPLLAAAGLFVTLSSALGQKSIISANKQAGVLTLVENSRPVARIHVSSTGGLFPCPSPEGTRASKTSQTILPLSERPTTSRLTSAA